MAANKYVALVSGKLKEIFASVTGTANAIPAGDATGHLDISWMPVGIGAETISATASETLAAGDFVNLYNNSGVLGARKADATTNGKPAHGFVLAGVASSGTATVYMVSQTNTQVTGLTIGSEYWLSTTPGALTTTPPSATGNLVQFMGVASKTTEIVFANVNTVEVA
jgi:hypothetical protein